MHPSQYPTVSFHFGNAIKCFETAHAIIKLAEEMIKEGLAVVYEGKTGAEFDGREGKYRRHEFIARAKKKGLWSQKRLQTPGEYKKQYQ